MKSRQTNQPKSKKELFKEMSIPFPGLWLGIIVLSVYAVSFNNGFTELDDKIFIVDNASYNEDVSNLVTSFNRGVFSDTSDTYYRRFYLIPLY